MKKSLLTLVVIFSFITSGLAQKWQTWPPGSGYGTDTTKVHKRDSTKRNVISVGYQPAIGGDMFGAGLYIHNLVSKVGMYASMTGLRKVVEGDQSAPQAMDTTHNLYDTSPNNWHTINFGLSVETASNFFIYCGYSTGAYSVWITDRYTPKPPTNRKPYTVVTEQKYTKPGVDFGAMYYAGKGWVRFGLQLGYNTSMKSVLAGIQMGVFIK